MEPSQVRASTPDTAQTVDLMLRMRDVVAYGRIDGLLERPLFFGDGETFPFFATDAHGCIVVDSSGREYVDWVNGFGPVILGYRRPEVEEAITAQLAAGPLMSLMHPVEIEVAERIRDMVPGADQIAFGKNGSDVVNAAIRVARAYTGREIILQHGFHGFHEWYTCSLPGVEGLPAALRELVHPFPYNDLDALRELFERFPEQVAVVVMEPVNTHMPEPGYLEGVRDLAHEHGALLVFDEMVTGFRLANGGAQEYFGVTPDLACYGKALANGMPLSAITGKREYMAKLTSTAYGMTYRGEALSLAAARATLDVLVDEPVTQRLAEIGAHVRAAFQELCERTGVHCTLMGPDPRLTFAFDNDGGLPWETIRLLFVQECLKRGVLTNGNLLPSYALGEEDIARSLDVFEGALETVARAVEAGKSGDTRGAPGPIVAKGFVTVAAEEPGGLRIHGWMFVGDRAPGRIELEGAGGTIPAVPVERPDLAEAYPQAESAAQAGFAAVLPPGSSPPRPATSSRSWPGMTTKPCSDAMLRGSGPPRESRWAPTCTGSATGPCRPRCSS